VVAAAACVAAVGAIVAASRTGERSTPIVQASVGPVSGVRVAAAGDIACDPRSDAFAGGLGDRLACRQRTTSDLLVADDYAAVLALGDTPMAADDAARLFPEYLAAAEALAAYVDAWH